MRMPETCWAVFKRQVINSKICCIWLVDSVGNLKSLKFAPSPTLTHTQHETNSSTKLMMSYAVLVPKATSPHKPVLIFPHLSNPPLHICHNHRTKDTHPNLSTLSKISDPTTTPSESLQPSNFNLKPKGWDFHSWLKQPDTFLIRNRYSHVWFFASVLLL